MRSSPPLCAVPFGHDVEATLDHGERVQMFQGVNPACANK
jgi:hypothetical protein